MKNCKISSEQIFLMVPKNVFPGFKSVALAGKPVANYKTEYSVFEKMLEILKWWIWWNPSKILKILKILKTTGPILEFATGFPASATDLNPGNTFFGTIKKFCSEEILQKFL